MAGRLWVVILATSAMLGCTDVSADSEYFGRVTPPEGQTLRYISGSEPQTMDPQVGTGQPESRIYLALFDGVTEHHPQTNQPTPSLAVSWDANADTSEFVFLFPMREDARWFDGEPITAEDVVYSWRRALSPELAAPNAYLAFHPKYSQAYNESGFFVRDPENGSDVLEFDVFGESAVSPETEVDSGTTPFRRFMSGPMRLTLPCDEESQQSLY